MEVCDKHPTAKATHIFTTVVEGRPVSLAFCGHDTIKYGSALRIRGFGMVALSMPQYQTGRGFLTDAEPEGQSVSDTYYWGGAL